MVRRSPIGTATRAAGFSWRFAGEASVSNITNRNVKKGTATFIGMTAIALWSTTAGLVRAISQDLGPVGGAAVIYTGSFVFLVFISGIPKIRSYPPRYLYAGGLLFALYSVSFSLSLGYAHSNRQAIEAAMLNYLWPGLTILFAILFNRQKANVLIAPGLLLSFLGVCWVLGDDKGFRPDEMLLNIQDNPLCYFLAFSSSLLWAAYCIVVVKTSRGQAEITLFMLFASLAFWAQFLLGENPSMRFDFRVAACVAIAAFAFGAGSAAWNVGIVHGNMTVLATVSYFTPVLSAAFASFLLSVSLTSYFWQGAFMVCIGSFLCWISTRKGDESGPGKRRSNRHSGESRNSEEST
jgi:drug/metabolite transporter (DMT)-like permease